MQSPFTASIQSHSEHRCLATTVFDTGAEPLHGHSHNEGNWNEDLVELDER